CGLLRVMDIDVEDRGARVNGDLDEVIQLLSGEGKNAVEALLGDLADETSGTALDIGVEVPVSVEGVVEHDGGDSADATVFEGDLGTVGLGLLGDTLGQVANIVDKVAVALGKRVGTLDDCGSTEATVDHALAVVLERVAAASRVLLLLEDVIGKGEL